MSKVRVRFAPSPTGNLHLGSARTALFNYLFVKSVDGVNILRVEDTDFDRSAEVYVENILEGLKWLGINYDEGPFYQSQRLEIYKKYADKILKEGHVYKCYCTSEELEERRKVALSLGKPPRYDGRCKKLTPEQMKKFEAEGRTATIRFEVGDRVIKFNDLVRGEVKFDCSLIGDFVIIKSNGTPAYNFAAVIDDALMKITHVVRGEDHISNTPKQILLYEALGFTPPQFAHISMILGPDRTKLSKRHGAKSVSEFMEEGYLKEALLNFLMLLSWSPKHDQEILSLDKAVKLFKLEDLSKSPSVFDIEKLQWMNGIYIRHLPVKDLTERCIPFMKQAQYDVNKYAGRQLEEIVDSVKDNLIVLSDIAKYVDFYFKDEPDYQDVKDALYKPESIKVLELFPNKIERLSEFSHESINASLAEIAKELGLKKGQVLKPVRIALTGKTAGPELWRVIRIYGAEKCKKYIEHALKSRKM
ncbi:MAG: glutamate--tRNA ligase [Candidatus Margulisbacteria bacterium]|nr:glutamate--tRNA ligase [Candidatus Margulisiibacteriota bacterium]MBU1021629.1 glutamate--tRNA ligase [Candidatus Margulisiibacteriota bacterium]MBU1728779.1 glutamate--tRNA ligase [Candidatus Margulisiibacteriota bacterium]MBU1955745.1 glutamate--tRNA ligase [Candidatus Margulisiibacteriota bacterium]